ncbi:putative disease resistance protein [Camellia lanceoleosa]|uniref:Disease resistance protein n=1 Tax=Camellia lanceoleosa TaxID=1840588 RepID=A0ACC0IIA6_9ERIC|nr:putative disease resistance protein [Camellia lanceoleosa]
MMAITAVTVAKEEVTVGKRKRGEVKRRENETVDKEDHAIHFEAIKKVASSGMESDEKKAFGKMEKKASPSSASKQVFDKEEGLTSSSPDKEECVGMIRKIEALTRKIDLIHLLRSYQSESAHLVQPYRPQSFDFRQKFDHLPRQLRDLKALVSNNNHVKHENFHVQKRINTVKDSIEEKFQDVKRNSVHEDSGIWAFIPQEEDDIMSLDESLTQKSFSREGSANWNFKRQEDDIMKSYEENLTHKTEVGLTPETSRDELLEIAINSAVRQVSKCIQDGIREIRWSEYGIIRKIGISGLGGEKVASALKDMQMVISRCSVILRISVSRHHSIEEIRQNITTQTGRLRSGKTDYTSEGSQDQYLPDNFLLLVDCIDGQIDLHDLKIPDCGFLVLTTQSQKVHEIMDLDLEIRMEDHLLPWKLFCWNVGPSLVHSSSVIQQMAVRLVKGCHGHLRAIVLLARALKGVTDIGVWKLALNQVLVKPKPNQIKWSQVFRVLKFLWDRKDIITKRCIINCADCQERRTEDSLVSSWIEYGLVETKANGKVILQELINSFLLENLDNGFVQMHRETRFAMRSFIPSHLRLGGLGLTETPEVERWFYSQEIELMNNKLSELPEKPECSFLQKLLLHNNYDLMEIPQLFFQDMPCLTHLDLSYTSIKSLPPSISNLKSLKIFFLRGCELLMELPPDIGALENLELFDLEGTEIMYLPKEFGKLINLRRFKVSFCQPANRCKETKQMDTTIPTGVLSKLNRLQELIIDVNPDGEWWDADVKVILNELSNSKSLFILELYLPSAELLQQLLQRLRRDSTEYLTYFRFTVGHHRQRIICRLPHEVEEIFKKRKERTKCLEYINGEGIPAEITKVLNHANFFFLDRHWTLKMLSDFGNENLVNLRFCLLVECNELQTIIDGDYEYLSGVDKKSVFKNLKYLGIHYMWNLQSIWKGPIDEGCLSNLKVLALHTCPNLTTIFTPDLLGNLRILEELIVEDCCKIKSLVSQESSDLKNGYLLQLLKRISLLDLPELVSISDVLSISPMLESLIVYNCPKLETLYAKSIAL